MSNVVLKRRTQLADPLRIFPPRLSTRPAMLILMALPILNLALAMFVIPSLGGIWPRTILQTSHQRMMERSQT